MRKPIDLKVIGVRGPECKMVALIFSNKKEILILRHRAIDLLGKNRWRVLTGQNLNKMRSILIRD